MMRSPVSGYGDRNSVDDGRRSMSDRIEADRDSGEEVPDEEDIQTSPVAQQPTEADGVVRGRAARAETPRSSHSILDASSDRDPVGLLEDQAAGRVPELVPIRYGRMLVSPFTFYRGAAAIMAQDLVPTPRAGLSVQLCGDAHLSNFGGFAAPDRSLVFDVNDFDETLPGPFEWDVKRLAASFEIAGRDRDFSPAKRRTAVLSCLRTYREAMRSFATMNELDVWYSRLDAEAITAQLRAEASTKQATAAEKNMAKARTKDSMKALAKLTRIVDGKPQIVSEPPLIVPIRELVADAAGPGFEEMIRKLLRVYRRSLLYDRRILLEEYRYADMARKVVGVGSVGTRAWIILSLGRNQGDPLFLQVKEAQASVLERHLGRSGFRNHGRRVVEGQRMMQAASDIFLGWVHNPGNRRCSAGLLHPPAVGLEGVGRRRGDLALWARAIRKGVRMDAGAGARTIRRPNGDRRLPGQERRLRPCRRRLRRGLRGSERTRPRRVARGGRLRPHQGGGGHVARRGPATSPDRPRRCSRSTRRDPDRGRTA